tara:strand:+ start:1716 stop:2522 length:807 start_codon:yes stop_codon:yes gene_type:complete
MTFSKQEVLAIVAELEQAEETRNPIPHISKRFPDMNVAEAYAIQSAWVALKRKKGRRRIGWKIGLTSRAMQRAAGITEPDYGQLLDNMLFWSGSRLNASDFIIPRIETELAFQLKSPLKGPDCSLLDVLAATDWVIPSLELIDARVQIEDPVTGEKRKVLDTISDNAANAAIILGGTPVRPSDVDLARVSATLSRNEVVEDSGVAAAVLGHPAQGVAWLANKISHHDEQLEAGSLVLGGSFTSAILARAGDTFYADYGDLGIITVGFD